MRVQVKIGDVEVVMAEENQRTSKEFDDALKLQCQTLAQMLYEKYMQNKSNDEESNDQKDNDTNQMWQI